MCDFAFPQEKECVFRDFVWRISKILSGICDLYLFASLSVAETCNRVYTDLYTLKDYLFIQLIHNRVMYLLKFAFVPRRFGGFVSICIALKKSVILTTTVFFLVFLYGRFFRANRRLQANPALFKKYTKQLENIVF